MNLLIDGITAEFTLDSLNVDAMGGSATICSRDLAEYITLLECELADAQAQLASDEVPEVPAVPVPPKAKVYEYLNTGKSGTSLDAFREQGWSDDLLVEHGYAEKVEVIEAEDEVPDVPTPPKDEVPEVPVKAAVEAKTPEVPAKVEASIYLIDGIQYKEAGKAAGCTRAKFLDKGWADEDLIKEGYIIEIEGQNLEPETIINENGDITDAAGTVYDPKIHGKTKTGKPALTVKGIFKNKRNSKKVETPDVPGAGSETPDVPTETKSDAPDVPTETKSDTPDVPAASKASDVPEVPAASKASEAASAPTVGGLGDDDLDDELADILKSW